MLIKDTVSSILVIVPHEDDEINLMGGLIPLLHRSVDSLHFLFLTNGDAMFDGSTRITEAINALKVFDIKEENIHFLGYPDASDLVDHSIYKSEDVIKTRCGSVTYGTDKINDYAFEFFGRHSEYTYGNLKSDLKTCILMIRPQIIFATDFDSHHDHRLCSMVFEEVISDILFDSSLDYFPYIYKGFAYSTSYGATNDFYSINLQETIKPSAVNLARNTVTELDNPLLSWQSRIQFPVDYRAITGILHHNIVYKSLKEHVSQCVSLKSMNIINADKCFWERPTYNLIYKARIFASSGNVKDLLDFRLFDIKNIGEQLMPIDFEFIGWKPDDDDTQRSINIMFGDGVAVRNINIYIHTLKTDNEPIVKMFINDDICLNIIDFKKFGTKYEYVFDKVLIVESLTIKIVSESTTLLYTEILPDDIQPLKFAKIRINGNFSYTYRTNKEQTEFPYEVYTYGVCSKDMKLICDDTNVNVGKDMFFIPQILTRCKLSLINTKDGEIYDTVSIIRMNFLDKLITNIDRIIDKIYVILVHKTQKYKRHILKNKVR